MPKRQGSRRPTPLQERYYRRGLNEGAVLMLREAYEFGIDRELAHDLEHFLTRLQCRAAGSTAPSLQTVHPMAVWDLKKRRGR